MSDALDKLKEGSSFREVSKQFLIPISTLHKKFHGNERHFDKPGRSPYLTTEEESALVEWISNCAEAGLPRSRKDIRFGARDIVLWKKRPNPFPDDLPTDK